MHELLGLTACRRVAIVGMAKNTGKTVTLHAVLAAFAAREEIVGVTSVGRDGERYDVLTPKLPKPPIALCAGSLVATTAPLLERSGLRAALLDETPHRTALGPVVVARLAEAGELEVAGPGSASAVGDVAQRMLAHGAQRVVIDGALDRRAACAPAVADGVILATGAVLHPDAHEVVQRTRTAVALLRLPRVADPSVRELAARTTATLAVAADGTATALPDELGLNGARCALVPALERRLREATHVIVRGAVCEPLLERLSLARPRARETVVVARHAAAVFFDQHDCSWYARRGVALEVVDPITLLAVTVNPVAPGTHRFDSAQLCAQVRAAVGDVRVLDVLAPG